MKNLEFALGIVLFVLMGCTAQTHYLSKESKWAVFGKINDKKGKHGKIKTTNQTSVKGKNIVITSDSTVWIDPKTKKRNSIATSTIEEIEFSDNSAPYLIAGAGIGLLGGAITGFILGLVGDSETATKNTLNPFSNEETSGIRQGVIIGPQWE